jgi:CubicO group peptidase (beta-lactamase class C family)
MKSGILIFLFTLSLPAWSGLTSMLDQTINDRLKEPAAPVSMTVLIGKDDNFLYHKAFGKQGEYLDYKNTVDAIYDIASVTKLFTATSISILVEEGKLKFSDKLSKFFDEYKEGNKKDITVEMVLRHKSGIPAVVWDHDIVPNDPAKTWSNVLSAELRAIPGARFIYSDVGFMILGHLIEKLSGKNLNQFMKEKIFSPLAMNSTGYNINCDALHKCIPTAPYREIGEPHDPKAYLLGGMAGHAGLFSTTDNMSRFIRLILNEGVFNGKRLLSNNSVKLMTELLPGEIRGLGFDIISRFSNSVRGEKFPKGKSYGHTGYTGTSLWIDKTTKGYVIILSNRVFPDDSVESKRKISQIRKEVATMVAQNFGHKRVENEQYSQIFKSGSGASRNR